MGHQEARPLLQVVSETRTHCIAQPELRTHRLLGKYVGRQASWLRHLNRQRIGSYRWRKYMLLDLKPYVDSRTIRP